MRGGQTPSTFHLLFSIGHFFGFLLSMVAHSVKAQACNTIEANSFISNVETSLLACLTILGSHVLVLVCQSQAAMPIPP